MKKMDLEYLKNMLVYDFVTNKGKNIYVDCNSKGKNNGETWEDAFKNVEIALDNSQEEDIIFISEGDYNLNTSIKVNNLKIYGGYKKNKEGVWIRNKDKSKTNFKGINSDVLIRIENISNLELNSINFTNKGNKCIESINSSPILKWCNFIDTENNIDFGGAIYFYKGNPIVLNSYFFNNKVFISETRRSAGGAITVDNSNIIIFNSIFDNNKTISLEKIIFDNSKGGHFFSYGGAMYIINNSEGIISNCIFKENKSIALFEFFDGYCTHKSGFSRGGAIFLINSEKIIIKECEFLNNIADKCCNIYGSYKKKEE